MTARSTGFVELVLVGYAMATVAVAGEIPPSERRSGYQFMGRELQAMQDDETANPGMLAVLDGEALWRYTMGAAGKSCADCHGEAAASMTGVASRYPAYDPTNGRPIDLDQRINLCRTERQQVAALPFESRELLALAAYVAHQSQGKPISVEADDPQARETIHRGENLFKSRQGQLNLSCAQCHDDNWGRRLAGTAIPQAHPTGYPVYRLEWQSLGSLRRRIRNCLTGMRAEPYPADASEIADLELYLAWRARGLPAETPAVRP